MEIPQELLDLGVTSLEQTELDLSNNNLDELPESIGLLTNLVRLELGSNNLEYLPESIGNLTNLERLELGSNNLEYLPESIGNLTKLEYLDLESNNLTSLPESFGNLTNLEGLYLYENNIDFFEIYVLEKKLPKIASDVRDYYDGNFSEDMEFYYNAKEVHIEECKNKLKEPKTREDMLLILKHYQESESELIKNMEDKAKKILDEMDDITKIFLQREINKYNYDFTPKEKCKPCQMHGDWDHTPEDCYCEIINEENLNRDVGLDIELPICPHGD